MNNLPNLIGLNKNKTQMTWKSFDFIISVMLKVPDGTFSWKWFKSLAQRSDLNLVGSTWSPK